MSTFSSRHWLLAIGAAISLQVGAAVWLLPPSQPVKEQGAGGIEISLSLAGARTTGGGSTAPEPMEEAPQPQPKPQPESEPEPKPAPRPEPKRLVAPKTPSKAPATRMAMKEIEAPQRAPTPKVLTAGAQRSGVSGAEQALSAGAQAARLDYYSRLAASLNRHKRYPFAAKRARQEGIVKLRFTIDRQGRVVRHELAGSSGHALLDDAVVDMLKKAEPLPAIPDELERDELTIVLPIEFTLRRR